MKMLSSGRRGRATNRVISSGGANFVSVSRGDALYSKSPPSTRRARLSISVLTAVLPDVRHDSAWLGGTRDLEAHHVELLAEPVQSRWTSVAGVALKVVLSRKGGNRLRSPGTGDGDQSCEQREQTCRDKHDHSEAFEHAPPSYHLEPGRTPRHTRARAGQRPGANAA